MKLQVTLKSVTAMARLRCQDLFRRLRVENCGHPKTETKDDGYYKALHLEKRENVLATAGRVVIRAPSHPPCPGTLEWFESRPDIPEEITAQTPSSSSSSSSQSATNSRIAVLRLKIVIWTREGWRAGCLDGARCKEE